MKIYGNASPGGPLEATHVPVPKVGLARDGSDIASRMASRTTRTSPLGPLPTTEQIREAEVRAQKQPDIRRVGLKPAKWRRGGGYLDHDEIGRLYQGGVTVKEICARFGCTRTPVYQALTKLGIERTGGKK